MVTPPRHDRTDRDADDVSDATLIARSLDEPEAFMPLVSRHHRVLFGYLARRIGADRAEDVTSETFARAFAQRHRFDLDRPDARPWLFGIATNVVRSAARTESRQLRAFARHGATDVHHDDLAAVDARLDVETTSAAVARALDALAPGDREVLGLFAWADLSYEEIAAALEIPTGTVRSRLNRARRVVTEQLEQARSSSGATIGDVGREEGP